MGDSDMDTNQPRRLLEIDAAEVSAVDYPANNRKLLVVKRNSSEEDNVAKAKEKETTDDQSSDAAGSQPEVGGTETPEEEVSKTEAQKMIAKAAETLSELASSLSDSTDPLGQDAVSKALQGFEEHREALVLLGVQKGAADSEAGADDGADETQATIAKMQAKIDELQADTAPAPAPEPEIDAVSKSEYVALVKGLNDTFEKLSEVVKGLSDRVADVESMHPVSKGQNGGETPAEEDVEVEKSQAQKLFGGFFAGLD